MLDGEIVLEVRGDDLWWDGSSTALTDAVRTFTLELGRTPRQPVSYKRLNDVLYDDPYNGQNTPRLRQVASELRRKLTAVGLEPARDYLPSGGPSGYVLMVRVEERVPTPLAQHPPADADTLLDTPCPYRGLDAFREQDADVFAGRESSAAKLQRLVERQPLVAVIGASGSGKSSIVQAGLLPRLRASRPPAVTWDALTFSPGDDPFFALASTLLPLLGPDLGPTDLLTERRRLAASLADGSVPLHDPLDDLRARTSSQTAQTARWTRTCATTPCAGRSRGASACSMLRRSACSAGWGCSSVASPLRPPPRCSSDPTGPSGVTTTAAPSASACGRSSMPAWSARAAGASSAPACWRRCASSPSNSSRRYLRPQPSHAPTPASTSSWPSASSRSWSVPTGPAGSASARRSTTTSARH